VRVVRARSSRFYAARKSGLYMAFLDFQDLIMLTRNLLRDQAEVRETAAGALSLCAAG